MADTKNTTPYAVAILDIRRFELGDLPDGHTLAGCDFATTDAALTTYRAVNAHDALVRALEAIQARIDGNFDHPSLVEKGPLQPSVAIDVRRYAEEALRLAEGKAAATTPPDPLKVALQWLLDDMHDAGETHGTDNMIYDSVANAAAALILAGGNLSWYTMPQALALLEDEKRSR